MTQTRLRAVGWLGLMDLSNTETTLRAHLKELFFIIIIIIITT